MTTSAQSTDLLTEAQAAKALAEAKAAEAEAAQAVAAAKLAEAKAAAAVAEKKAAAAGFSATASPDSNVSENDAPADAPATPAQPAAPEASEAVVEQGETEKKGFVARLLDTIQESLLPHPNYAPGEDVLQIIHMAPYRATIPKILAVMGLLLLLVSIAFFLMYAFTAATHEADQTLNRELSNLQLYMWGSLITALAAFIQALRTGLAYKQWQFIMTDTRIIITTPDPDQGLFADSIYLKDGTLKVLDTNFSKSAIWVPFQIFTGARDVMLSTGAYEFMEAGAKVKGGIRFPDVGAADIKKLESLVFSDNK